MNNQAVITKRGDIYDTLEAIDRGGVTKELRQAMREGTLASIETMKKSKITLEITIDPDTKTDPLSMRVSANVKLTKPASQRKAAIFYPTGGGDLTREHPRQQEQRDIEDFTSRPAHITNGAGHVGTTASGTSFDQDTGEVLQEGGGN